MIIAIIYLQCIVDIIVCLSQRCCRHMLGKTHLDKRVICVYVDPGKKGKRYWTSSNISSSCKKRKVRVFPIQVEPRTCQTCHSLRKTREHVEKPWCKARTNNKLNHLWHRARSEPEPHWWEASALTTARLPTTGPSLLPETCPVCPLIWNVLYVIKTVPTIPLLQSFPVFSQVSSSFFPFSLSLFSLLSPVLLTRRNLD